MDGEESVVWCQVGGKGQCNVHEVYARLCQEQRGTTNIPGRHILTATHYTTSTALWTGGGTGRGGGRGRGSIGTPLADMTNKNTLKSLNYLVAGQFVIFKGNYERPFVHMYARERAKHASVLFQ